MNLNNQDILLQKSIDRELNRQRNTIEMIASENFTSPAVMKVVGSILTNKYAEGYPGKRYYGGCEFVDEVENIARDRAKKLFNCEYANVQPHSGSQANMGIFQTILNPGDTVLGLNLAHGGHLTHGSPVNFSGKLYNFVSYGVNEDTGRVDFNNLLNLAIAHKPTLIICGGSAYPRIIEFEQFRKIADEVGAFLMADIAHPAGLIASGIHPSPWPHCHFVTSTTHKTLRGPRGGLILMGKNFKNTWGKIAPKSGRKKMVSELIDSAIMPGIQGGPLMHVIAGKAVAFREALTPEFKKYCKNIVDNAKLLANDLLNNNFNLVTGGTDTHVILLDLSDKNISGQKAEHILESAGITTNKNMVPFDKRSPMITSGIRLGTPALTTRGMGSTEMKKIADWIEQIINNPENKKLISSIRENVKNLCDKFPLYETENEMYELST